MYTRGFALGSPVLTGPPNHLSITRLRGAPTRLVANASPSQDKDKSQEVASVVGIDLGTTNSAIAVSIYSIFDFHYCRLLFLPPSRIPSYPTPNLSLYVTFKTSLKF